jgi:hypothetical protein
MARIEWVPTSFLRQLVIRQNIGPDLVFGQIVQADGRHLADAQQFCGCDPTLSGNDHSRAIDKNRVGEAERSDAVRKTLGYFNHPTAIYTLAWSYEGSAYAAS